MYVYMNTGARVSLQQMSTYTRLPGGIDTDPKRAPKIRECIDVCIDQLYIHIYVYRCVYSSIV